MPTHVRNVFLTHFAKKSGFDCCFLSAQCIERQARTSDDEKSWVFTPLNVKWRSFIDKVVYSNKLRSIKIAFFELEKAMYTVATPVPMFTIITPGRYTHSKQSENFHVKFNLKMNCEKECATTWPLSCTFASKSHWYIKKGLNVQQRSLHDCKTPQQICESWQINCVFRLFLDFSTQLMEFEDKQAYKTVETGVLVWKIKEHETISANFSLW